MTNSMEDETPKPQPDQTQQNKTEGDDKGSGADDGGAKDSKEKDEKSQSFRQLWTRAKREMDPQERHEVLTEISTRVQEAEDNGFIDRTTLPSAIISTLAESTWEERSRDYYYRRMLELAQNEENAARGISGYRDNPRYEGMARSLVELAANRTQAQGIERRINQVPQDQRSKWLSKKLAVAEKDVPKTITSRNLALEDDYVELLDFGDVNLAEVVGANQDSEPVVQPAPDNSELTKALDELKTLMAAQAVNAKRQTEIAEAQLETARRGFIGVVNLTETRSAIDPNAWEANPPPWYENMTRAEKDAVKVTLIWNFIAGKMAETGEADYSTWASIGNPEGGGYTPIIKKEALQAQWVGFPGYRMAVATMTEHIFKKNHTHNGQPTESMAIRDDGDERRNPNVGYHLLANSDRFVQFKKDLAASLVDYYWERHDEIEAMREADPDDPDIPDDPVQWAVDKHIEPEDVANFVVAAADNFLMGTCSYLSADWKRPYDPRNGGNNTPSIEDPQVNGGDDIRAVLCPGLKLPKKLIQEDRPGARPSHDVKEEYWLGSLGRWMRFNAIHNIDGFREDYKNGRINMVPDKLFPGLLEFNFIDDADMGMHTAGFLLVNKPKEPVGDGVGLVPELLDYEGGPDSIDFTRSDMGEWFGAWTGKRVQAVKLYQNLSAAASAGGRSGAMGVDAFMNALIRLRKMPCVDVMPELKEAYYNKDFVVASLANIITEGAGPVMGIREIVLNIDKRKNYDEVVNRALSGQANIYHEIGVTRKELLQTFHALDNVGVGATQIFEAFGLGNTLLADRNRLVYKATANLQKVARMH